MTTRDAHGIPERPLSPPEVRDYRVQDDEIRCLECEAVDPHHLDGCSYGRPQCDDATL